MPSEFEVVDRQPQPYVGTTRTVSMAAIPEIADRIPAIIGALVAQGDSLAGAPFLRYLVVGEELTIEAGVPVAESVTAPDGLDAGVLPGGRFAATTHLGDFDGLEGATADLLRWADARGLALDHDGDAWACRLESYETDPRGVPTEEQRTVVAIRLAG